MAGGVGGLKEFKEGIDKVADGLENISSGDADLSQRLPVTSKDETGNVSRFFNAFLEKLQSIIKSLQGDADSLSNAARSIHMLIQASVYAAEMATISNTVTDTVIQVDEAVLAILQTSEELQEMAKKSADTTRQFKT